MSLKLYIQPKTIIFAARVNEPTAVEYPRDYVNFDNIGVGTTGVVGPNQTVLIGSTAGASDLGVTRVRLDPTSSVLYIGRSSKGTRPGEVTLTDNAYISVLNEIPRVVPKVPYIDDDGETFFDSSLDYATYGATTPPVANAGSAVVGTIDSGSGKLAVNFSAANSFVTMPGASIASYTWNIGSGGSYTGGTTSADQDIETEFDPGFHVVTLLVADDNAKSHRAFVPVLAIDPSADPSIEAFEIVSHRITQQGQDLRIRIREDIDEDTYLDGTFVMLWDSEPADADDRSNVVFQGWIQISDEEIRGTRTGLLRDVTLTCLDVAGRLKTIPGYSTVLEHASSPATWQEFNTPSMDIFIYHLLQWQSTALDVADFTFAGDEDDYTFKILSSDGASIFDQVDRRARALIPDHQLTCNRRGQLRIGIDPLLQDIADRTSTVQQLFNADDLAAITYAQQRSPRYMWLRSNTILTGTTTVATAFCIAPGTAPGWGAADMTDGEHLAQSQADLNATTGHRYARLNAPQGPFTLTLAAGDDLGLEPADLTWIRLTIDAAEAAQRGFTLLNARLLMQQIDIRYDHAATGLTKTVTIRAELETDGPPAVTEVIPEAEEVDDGGWGVTPGGTPPDFFGGGLDGGGQVAAIEANGYIYTTDDFTADPPTWSRNISAAVAIGITTNNLMSWVVDPFSPKYRGTGDEVNGWVHATSSVLRVTDIFGTPAYSVVKTFAEQANRTNGEWGVIAASFGRFFAAETDNPWLMSVRSHRNISGQNGVYCAYSLDAGATWSDEIAITTNYDTQISNSPRRIAGVYLSPRTPGYALVGVYSNTANPADGAIYQTTDWGATWSAAGITANLNDGIGYCFHVPWHSNEDESILYYTSFSKADSVHTWSTRRTDGSNDADVSPTNAGLSYGPFRQLFGIQSLDTNRQFMVMAGQANEGDSIDIDQPATGAVSAIFTSSDGGDTWTLRYGPTAGDVNGDWVAQVAFAAGDASKIYGWGNDGFVLYSSDSGANWDDKTPQQFGGGGWAATLEIIGIAGGGS